MFNKKRPFFKKNNNNNNNRSFQNSGNRPYQPRPRLPMIDLFERDHPRNEAIQPLEIRVLDENGENLGVMSKAEAIKMAQDRELDLVLYAPLAKPPVCKIVEWESFKYHIKKKEKEIKKSHKAAKVKEIKISSKITAFDLDRKMKKIEEILAKGDQVKVTIMRKYPTTPEQVNVFKDTMLTKLADSCTIISVQEKGKNIYILVKSKVASHAKT